GARGQRGEDDGPSAPRTLRTRVLTARKMPIYEDECHDGRRRVSLLVRSLSSAEPPACPRCGSTALSRLMSRFATVKSEEARLESLAEGGGLGDLDEGDPTSVGRLMKKMGRESGAELGEAFD